MSPAATQTLSEAERSVLEVADDLFYRCGISGVTMIQIRDAAGVSLRRMYSLFPSKADLVTGWLQERHVSWMRWFRGEISDRMSDGSDPIDAIFDALTQWVSATGYRGCGFINALAETTELTPDHHALIREHKQSLRNYLATLTDQGEALAVIVDGAIVQSAIFKSAGPMQSARIAAANLQELPPLAGQAPRAAGARKL